MVAAVPADPEILVEASSLATCTIAVLLRCCFLLCTFLGVIVEVVEELHCLAQRR
jgi:hypothetical protein